MRNAIKMLAGIGAFLATVTVAYKAGEDNGFIKGLCEAEKLSDIEKVKEKISEMEAKKCKCKCKSEKKTSPVTKEEEPKNDIPDTPVEENVNSETAETE